LLQLSLLVFSTYSFTLTRFFKLQPVRWTSQISNYSISPPDKVISVTGKWLRKNPWITPAFLISLRHLSLLVLFTYSSWSRHSASPSTSQVLSHWSATEIQNHTHPPQVQRNATNYHPMAFLFSLMPQNTLTSPTTFAECFASESLIVRKARSSIERDHTLAHQSITN